jgi:hypothetical protein
MMVKLTSAGTPFQMAGDHADGVVRQASQGCLTDASRSVPKGA